MIGFVICSRLKSSRIPRKALKPINGKPLLNHLLDRLNQTGLRSYLAVPEEEVYEYLDLYDDFHDSGDFISAGQVILYGGSESDPLRRMYDTAKRFGLKKVIRVTHDKIFIDPDCVKMALSTFMQKNLDYLYSTHFTDGSAFEIISIEALERAINRFKDVEHISYAIRAVTDNMLDWEVPVAHRS